MPVLNKIKVHGHSVTIVTHDDKQKRLLKKVAKMPTAELKALLSKSKKSAVVLSQDASEKKLTQAQIKKMYGDALRQVGWTHGCPTSQQRADAWALLPKDVLAANKILRKTKSIPQVLDSTKRIFV